jgi:hypothetical protein
MTISSDLFTKSVEKHRMSSTEGTKAVLVQCRPDRLETSQRSSLFAHKGTASAMPAAHTRVLSPICVKKGSFSGQSESADDCFDSYKKKNTNGQSWMQWHTLPL